MERPEPRAARCRTQRPTQARQRRPLGILEIISEHAGSIKDGVHSTSNAISLPPKRTVCFALRRWTPGGSGLTIPEARHFALIEWQRDNASWTPSSAPARLSSPPRRLVAFAAGSNSIRFMSA